MQQGQYSFTIASPGTSDRPDIGTCLSDLYRMFFLVVMNTIIFIGTLYGGCNLKQCKIKTESYLEEASHGSHNTHGGSDQSRLPEISPAFVLFLCK
jgi:hypothetical protein